MKIIFSQKTRLVVLMILVFNFSLKAQTTAVKVIPEVKSFTATSANFSFAKSTTIFVQTSNKEELTPVAEQLKEELGVLGIVANVSETSLNNATENSILLKKGIDIPENNEAYKIDISNGVTIAGATKTGTFWGTRTLLQLIENHNNQIPKGVIEDFPDYPSRGFMIDVGRKFFTIDFLRHYVKFMSYYKMNELHVHLNDNGFKKFFGNDWSKTYAAFRLESTTYPGLAAQDGHYTKEEFRNLQLLGEQYGVNVVPEIDVPAHSLAFTRYKPELQAKPPYAADHLDILNDAKLSMIYDFFDKLFDEYLDGENPTFIGTDVHIGTDEFVKEGNIYSVDNKQARRFREFTQHYIDYIADKGKRPRVWGGLRWLKDNPETKVTAKNGAIVNAWNKDWVDPQDAIEKGFKVISTPDTWLYIVPKAGYYRDFLDIQDLYTNYTPRKVNKSEFLVEKHPALLGASFAVWNDIIGNGISQLDVHYRVLPAMKVMATKTWNVMPKRSWQEYEKLYQQTSEGVGKNLMRKYTEEELSQIMAKIGSESLSFDGKKEIELNGGDVGYNYEVSFDIKTQKNKNPENAILFQSDYGKITLNTNGTQKLGFSRDGYTYIFDYEPCFEFCATEWEHIKLVGNYESITLYVNGELKQKLGEKQKGAIPNFQQTLCFPIQKVGDKENGFVGMMKNLKIVYMDVAKEKEEFLKSKYQLPDGEYYIIYNGKYLTNTNKNGYGGNPVFRNKSNSKTSTIQHWKIEYDNTQKRHKITSVADDRYLNELGNFGTNPYYKTWNTYTFYKKDDMYGVQNGGDAGVDFWTVKNNRIEKGGQMYSFGNYQLQFVKVEKTGVNDILESDYSILITKDRIEVKSTQEFDLTLLNLEGKLMANTSKKNTIYLSNSVVKGAYLLKIANKSSQITRMILLQ